jgi:hypothetical protein
MKNKQNKRVRAVFENLRNLRSEDIESSEILKELLKNEVPKSIQLAHESKKIFASVFEINSTGAYLEIHRNHWIPALETVILWRIESDREEDYKMCAKLRDLIVKIRESNRSKKIVNVNKMEDRVDE